MLWKSSKYDSVLNIRDCQELKYFRLHCEVYDTSNNDILDISNRDQSQVNVDTVEIKFKIKNSKAYKTTSGVFTSAASITIDVTKVAASDIDITYFLNYVNVKVKDFKSILNLYDSIQ